MSARFVVSVAVLVCAVGMACSLGCSTRKVGTRADGSWSYDSQRFGAKEQVRRVVVRKADGTSFELEGYQSDTAEVVAAAVAAGVQAAMTSMVPGAGALRSGPPLPVKVVTGPGGTFRVVPTDDPSEPVPEIE